MTEYVQVPGKMPGITWPKDPRIVRVNLSTRPVCPSCGVPLSGSIDRVPSGGRVIECLNPNCMAMWAWDQTAQRPVAPAKNAPDAPELLSRTTLTLRVTGAQAASARMRRWKWLLRLAVWAMGLGGVSIEVNA